MNESGKKAKRMTPLVRVKKIRLDQQTLELARIRGEKVDAVKKLREFQAAYIRSIDMVNQVRENGDFRNLNTLEQGSDLLKSKWFLALKEVQSVEAREKAQLSQLKVAQRELESFENLKERYEVLALEFESKRFQAEMDALALRGFRANAK